MDIPAAIRALDPKQEYRVTNEAVRYWFGIFNKTIWNDKLPSFDTIQIRPFVKNWAMCIEDTDNPEVTKYRLSINIHFPNFKLFLDVLAHEMVHLYQFINGDDAEHNEMFFSWQKKLARHGLSLKEYYIVSK